MQTVNAHIIFCQHYEPNPKKVEGSYTIYLRFDRIFEKTINNVKDPEAGLEIIKDIIKDFQFSTVPDLTIYDSKILGRHIYSRVI